MCLVFSSKIENPRRIAEEDIVCYKVVKQIPITRVISMSCTETIEVVLLSMFHPNFDWELGKRYDLTTEEEVDKCYINTYITGGFFHSFIDKGEAAAFRELYYVHGWPKILVITKCTIPKGVEYYVGTDSKGNNCYASKSLIMEEICA